MQESTGFIKEKILRIGKSVLIPLLGILICAPLTVWMAAGVISSGITSGMNGDVGAGAATIVLDNEDNPPAPYAILQDKEPIFFLGSFGGKLALYNPERDTVMGTYDVYINTLPPAEARALEKGIEIYDMEQLYSMIEAYTS